MGIFSFFKDAGTDGGTKIKEVVANKTTTTRDEKANEALLSFLAANGLEVKNPHVSLEGGKITVKGEVADQATKEKVILALGNLNGVGEVDEELTVLKTEAAAEFYTVVRGDSLSKIAKRFYNDAMKYPVIFEANKPMLKDPNMIYPGQVLRIPPLS